jgi:hypothetical protein
MRIMRWPCGRGRRLLLALAVLAATALSPSALAAPGECPTVMPVSEVTPGMHATGWTVASGRTPESFDVEILGVLADGIGPGRDMLVIDATGPVVDKGNGIWAGMSGSPLYADDGRLVGAVSYGLNDGPSGIGGATPVEDMLSVLDYGLAARAASPAHVALPRALQRRVASATGTRLATVSSGLDRLRIPLAVSGISSSRLGIVRRAAEHDGLSVLPYAVGSTASAGGGGVFEPGGNFAAALSYGDIALAGVGTTTYVCGGRALAFGHPMFWRGTAAYGASTADALAIVPGLVTSYKLANVDPSAIGTVDQDRLAGIAATVGPAPGGTPVFSRVKAIDSDTGATLRERSGSTQVVDTSALPFFSLLQLLANVDVTYDKIGSGTSKVTWSITGTRADGSPFAFTRRNRFASSQDVSFESVFELATYVSIIEQNPFERVAIDHVYEKAWVEDELKDYAVSGLRVRNRNGRYVRVHETLVAARGSDVHLRVVLRSPHAGTKLVDMTLHVPRHARSGVLDIRGGADEAGESGYFCFFDDEECEEAPADGSFESLLRDLRRSPRNDLVDVAFHRGGSHRIQARTRGFADGVVNGGRVFYVVVR